MGDYSPCQDVWWPPMAGCQTMACLTNMTLLIEHQNAKRKGKIPQAQEVNKVNKPGAE